MNCFASHKMIDIADCSLGPLVNKVKDVQVETIVDTLCSNMLSEKEQLRDISSIGGLKFSVDFVLTFRSVV